MKKYLLLAVVAFFATTAVQAQIGESKSSKRIETKVEKKTINELDFYLQNGWGLGWQLRKDFNKYVGWNIFGISYMSGFVSPADYGQVNFKFLGVRGYTPSYKWIRGYIDLNMGYTLAYGGIGADVDDFFDDYDYYGWGSYYSPSDYDYDGGTSVSHHFGLDFGVGVQLGKHFTLGYNLNFLAPGKVKSHWARIGFLF
jgi:hypothetical protein